MIESGPKQPENRMHLFDPVGLINDNYAQYGVRPRRATSNAIGGGLQFAVETKVADSDSGGSSPRLWKPNNSHNSPPTSPRFTSSPPQQSQNPSHKHQNPESMSPNSRTQAIARGRRELMDMIKDMPESFYELSLRDIVDQKPSPSPPPAPASLATVELRQPSQESKKMDAVEKQIPHQEAPKEEKNKKKKKVGKSDSKKKMMMKNRSVDNGGFLLKTTVFPIPFRSKKNKRSLSAVPSFKVATKPKPKGGEKRWWARKSRVSNQNEIESDSVSTSRSSSIVSRHKQSNRFLPSCCSFFNDKKIKAKK